MKQKRIVQIITVTPKIADQWLKKNHKNRRLRKGLIATYAEAMRRGQWKLTSEPICFCSPYRDPDTMQQMPESLMEGQHRLHAVIEANVSVPMTVWFGCDSSEFEALGQGRRRSAADILHLTHSQVKDPLVTASVANGFARYFLSYNRPVEPWMVQQLFGHYADQFARGATYKHKLGRLANQPAIAAFMAGRFVLAGKTDELVNQMSTGIGFKENDAGRRLWQYLNEQTMRIDGKDTPETIFYKCCNGVMYHLKGEDCMLLSDRTTGLAYLREQAKDAIKDGLRVVYNTAIPENFYTPTSSPRRVKAAKIKRLLRTASAA